METLQKQKPFLSTKSQLQDAPMNQQKQKAHPSTDSLQKLIERSSRNQRQDAKRSFPSQSQKVLTLPALTRIGEDGLDHLNFSPFAVTDLGKLLSLTNNLEFKHSLAGQFKNMDCFWWYVKSQDDDSRFRNAPTNVVRKLTYEVPMVEFVPNFFAIIGDAMFQRITAYPELAKAIKGMDLPFEYYNYPNNGRGAPVRPSIAISLIRCMEVIRKALKRGQEPNFHEFLDPAYQLNESANVAAKHERANLMIRRRFVTEHQDEIMEQKRLEAEAIRERREAADREAAAKVNQTVANIVEVDAEAITQADAARGYSWATTLKIATPEGQALAPIVADGSEPVTLKVVIEEDGLLNEEQRSELKTTLTELDQIGEGLPSLGDGHEAAIAAIKANGVGVAGDSARMVYRVEEPSGRGVDLPIKIHEEDGRPFAEAAVQDHPPEGTILRAFCEGTTKMYEIADGKGAMNVSSAPESNDCGPGI